MSGKFYKIFEAFDKVVMTAVYAGTLGSPVIGLVTGAIAYGTVPAALLGIVAGPLAAVALMGVYYVTYGKLAKHIHDKHLNAELGRPEPKKQPWTAKRGVHAVKELGKGLLRGAGWAISLGVSFITFGKVSLDLDGPQETNYIPPDQQPVSRSTNLKTFISQKFSNSAGRKPESDDKTKPASPKSDLSP